MIVSILGELVLSTSFTAGNSVFCDIAAYTRLAYGRARLGIGRNLENDLLLVDKRHVTG
jgi:hypothetical protein